MISVALLRHIASLLARFLLCSVVLDNTRELRRDVIPTKYGVAPNAVDEEENACPPCRFGP
ncbi:hypothetical protein, partial [Achromobacter dolens]|uniref:hypothetical protein n=1 Tax=Achromobacter dolens TaxID=1287738 RepID=UPI0031D4E67B